jgi:nucleoside-diphosphate-sugar epimerase
VIHRGAPSPDLSRFTLDARRVDVRDGAALSRALDGARVVVNCAVDKSEAPSSPRSVRSNVEACEQLVRACVTNRVQRLVHLSSIAVLPPRLTPDAVSRPFDYARERDWYRQVKVTTERQMLAARDRLEICVIRPGHVYGPTLNWSRLALSRGRRNRIAVPDPAIGSRCHVVFVGDLVRLIHRWAMLGVSPPPMVHAVSPEPVTWAAFFSEHAVAAGFPDPVVVSPLAELRRRVIPDRPPFARRVLRRLRASPLLDPLRGSPLLRHARAAAKAYRAPASTEPWTVWPTALELEQYLSSGEFSPAELEPRFSYETSFVDGCRMTAEWHNARWTALDDAEFRDVRELLRATRT